MKLRDIYLLVLGRDPRQPYTGAGDPDPDAHLPDDPDTHPNGGPSRIALMRRNGELRLALEQAKHLIEVSRKADEDIARSLVDISKRHGALRDASLALIQAWPDDDDGFDAAMARLQSLLEDDR